MMRDRHLAPLARIGEDLYDEIEALNVHHPSGMTLKLASLCVPDLFHVAFRLMRFCHIYSHCVLFSCYSWVWQLHSNNEASNHMCSEPQP
jgi:hypothetical protein